MMKAYYKKLELGLKVLVMSIQIDNKCKIDILGKITKELVVQGFDHKSNIEDYYEIMYNSVKAEFSEDNDITIKSFLLECFMDSLDIDKEHILKMLSDD